VVFKNYPFTVPTFYALVVRSLLQLEGLALSIDREYRVLAAAYPYVARRILLDVELRDSLAELLFDGVASADGGDQKAARFRWDRTAGLLRESSKSAAAVAGSTDDGELLLDLASSLLDDPAFRSVLLSELASTVDILLASTIGEAVGGFVAGQGEEAAQSGGRISAGTSDSAVLGALGLRDEDVERAAEVRETAALLAERFKERLPSGGIGDVAEVVARAAAKSVEQFVTQSEGGGAALPKLPKLPNLPPNLASDFLGRLSERAAVRTLRAAALWLARGEGNANDDRDKTAALPAPVSAGVASDRRASDRGSARTV